MKIIRISNWWSFEGEKVRESPFLVRSYLTSLGKRIEGFTYVEWDELEFTRRSRETDRRKTLNLKDDRMAVLFKARRLAARNGEDITVVMHLIDNESYVGKVILPDKDIKDFLIYHLMIRPQGLQLLVHDGDGGYNSAEEEVVCEKDRNV